MQKNEWAGFGYAPVSGYAPHFQRKPFIFYIFQHKTPSGAFDPEIFAPPSSSEIPNIDEINEINLRNKFINAKMSHQYESYCMTHTSNRVYLI